MTYHHEEIYFIVIQSIACSAALGTAALVWPGRSPSQWRNFGPVCFCALFFFAALARFGRLVSCTGVVPGVEPYATPPAYLLALDTLVSASLVCYFVWRVVQERRGVDFGNRLWNDWPDEHAAAARLNEEVVQALIAARWEIPPNTPGRARVLNALDNATALNNERLRRAGTRRAS